MEQPADIVEVALPCPLYKTFDYLTPIPVKEGIRVEINFAGRRVVGVVMAVKSESDYPREKLKAVTTILDEAPILQPQLLALAKWMASYYHAPIGEVIQLFLPASLRQGRSLFAVELTYQMTPAGMMWREAKENQRAKAKLAILNSLSPEKYYSEADLLRAFPNFKNHCRALVQEGLLEVQERLHNEIASPQFPTKEPAHQLTEAQQSIVDTVVQQAIEARNPQDRISFIEGVTGSGKTAVYTEIARAVLARGEQVLMLVPEIGLTPQFVSRIVQALGVRVGVIHSQVTDSERFATWRGAMLGELDLVIGTRSALFTPFARLGLMIIDEAHDGSYIQRDGVRYSAHNSAIKRAILESVPLILGSATPTYESILNIEQGRFRYYPLPERVSGKMPDWEIINCHEEKVYDGISNRVLEAIEATIARKEQVLIFLNRRGFSPVLACLDCGVMLECDHCSCYLNYHRTTGKLHCHQCGRHYPYPDHCTACGGKTFKELGVGTQKIEKVLSDAFPQANVLRFDRDSVKNSRDLEAHLTQIGEASADIIIGTQMLAKGHDFPNITLVVLLNSDGLFFANDFRADEKLAQLLVQVSGRAGRGEKRGKVMVQTMFPEHALFHQLPKVGYHAYALEALEIRQLLELPPYAYQILVQVEARSEMEAYHYLEGIMAFLPTIEEVEVTPVMPNNLSRRQDYYRVHTIFKSQSRTKLHQMALQLRYIYEANVRKDIRLLIEVDPIDFS
ncbi:primosomal protein N' [Ignatzschineria ureiclastica]|uniref:Replication restart protein PriA n=1 Tax=Ignatzschineria ureiclastica TaxID=472582 RepID=A0A2U2AES7_9GAMM|nr:primosomal protein N' [Ignatzschineria ureiclastica]PWD81168.1 primosomal protein N' [Ignatzschineria ureiclastica]GGZ96800.1 primosomal protein N' [Ignatzschineria ureiclastica]